MAGGAFFGRRLVEQHRLAIHAANVLVARLAFHVPMYPLQRKGGRLVVVKQGRLPFRAVVAVRAWRDLPLGELSAVNVFMAVFALGRGCLEIDVHELGFQVWRLMAINTRCGPVSTYEGKRSLRVIEARQFLPRFRRMESFTSRGFSIGPQLQHAVFELAFVRIGVATGAIEV